MNDNNNIALDEMNFIYEIKQIVTEARQKAYSAINSAMVEASGYCRGTATRERTC